MHVSSTPHGSKENRKENISTPSPKHIKQNVSSPGVLSLPNTPISNFDQEFFSSLKPYQLEEGSMSYFWSQIYTSYFSKQDTNVDLIYKLQSMSFNDTPLWTFLSIGYSEKFASLCVKDKLYYDDVRLDFLLIQNQTIQKQKEG